MAKTIFTRIRNKEITSVEFTRSSLGRELYVYKNGCWIEVLHEYGFSYSTEQFCQYIADYEVWAEHNNEYLEITEGKAKFRSSINAAKELLKEWLGYGELDKFRSLYTSLSARQKEAVVLVLRHSEILDTDLMCPTTSELSLLWNSSVKKQKHKGNLLVPVLEKNCTYTINLFTGEVVEYAENEPLDTAHYEWEDLLCKY